MSGDNKVGARIHLLKLGGFVVPVTLAFAVLDDAQSINPQVAYPNLSTNEGGIPNRLWLLAESDTIEIVFIDRPMQPHTCGREAMLIESCKLARLPRVVFMVPDASPQQ
jgi:hypothetical protein